MAQGPSHDRTLAAVLFTDIVGSTRISEELGDRRWKAALDRHHRIIRRNLKRFGGREIDTAGDGFFASFREPASAIACACVASEEVRELGIEIRAGVHFGECERVGKKLAGITVVIGSRIAALGAAGDVLVSGTAAELARGAGFGFEDRGPHTLKGVTDEVRVLSVASVDGVPRAASVALEEGRARRDEILVTAGHGRFPRALWIGVGAALVAVAAVVLSLTVFWNEESPVPGPDTVARINAEGAAFDRVLAVGSRADPLDVAFGAGELWVVNVTNRTLSGIDPESGDVRVFGMPSTPTGVAFAAGRVWVTFGFSSDAPQRVGALDPTRGALEPAPFSVPDGSYPIAVGANSLWIADPLGATVTRYDLATHDVESVELSNDSGPIDLQVSQVGASSRLWVASGREPSVYRLDAANPARARERFGTGNEIPTALSVDPSGTAWLVSEERDTAVAVASSGTTRVSVAIGDRCNGPVDVAATGRSVWVSCALSRTVVLLDPTDGSVVRVLHVQGTPGKLAIDSDGAVWVAIQGV